MKKKITIGKIIFELLSIVTAITFIIPVLWAIAASFKTEGTPISSVYDWFAPPYTLTNYPEIIFNSNIPLWFTNSLFVAIISTMLVVLFSSMAAYSIAKINFKGSRLFFIYFLLGLMVPGEATIIPLFITVNELNLIDSFPGLILPSLAGSMNVVIMVTFFRGIPNELFEAARIDGANSFHIFTRVLLPLAKTVLSTVSIFAFLGSWNNYLWPLLCAMSEAVFTLPVGLPSFTSVYTEDYVLPMTANMVASIPAIILFLFFEKRIVQGVALSGIKG